MRCHKTTHQHKQPSLICFPLNYKCVFTDTLSTELAYIQSNAINVSRLFIWISTESYISTGLNQFASIVGRLKLLIQID